MTHITLCSIVFPTNCPPTGPSWRSCNTFYDSCASKHLSNTPLWCFQNNTSCTNWYDNALSRSALFFHVEKWEGTVPCLRYWRTSLYQYFMFIVGETRSTLYISISCSHSASSSSTSFTFISYADNRKIPWPLIVWTSLMSISYSYNLVIQLHLLSCSSCCTSSDLTIGRGIEITQRFFNR